MNRLSIVTILLKTVAVLLRSGPALVNDNFFVVGKEYVFTFDMTGWGWAHLVLGVVVAGFMLWGYPASPTYDSVVTPWGNFIGAIIMFALGFVPCYILGAILKSMNLLRIPKEIELVGLDLSEYAARYDDEADIVKAEIEEARRIGIIR